MPERRQGAAAWVVKGRIPLDSDGSSTIEDGAQIIRRSHRRCPAERPNRRRPDRRVVVEPCPRRIKKRVIPRQLRMSGANAHQQKRRGKNNLTKAKSACERKPSHHARPTLFGGPGFGAAGSGVTTGKLYGLGRWDAIG